MTRTALETALGIEDSHPRLILLIPSTGDRPGYYQSTPIMAELLAFAAKSDLYARHLFNELLADLRKFEELHDIQPVIPECIPSK